MRRKRIISYFLASVIALSLLNCYSMFADCYSEEDLRCRRTAQWNCNQVCDLHEGCQGYFWAGAYCYMACFHVYELDCYDGYWEEDEITGCGWCPQK